MSGKCIPLPWIQPRFGTVVYAQCGHEGHLRCYVTVLRFARDNRSYGYRHSASSSVAQTLPVQSWNKQWRWHHSASSHLESLNGIALVVTTLQIWGSIWDCILLLLLCFFADPREQIRLIIRPALDYLAVETVLTMNNVALMGPHWMSSSTIVP